MKKNNIFIICGKELLNFSRDRRTLYALMFFPVLGIPGIVYMFSLLIKNPKIAPMIVTGLFQCLPMFFLSLIGHLGFDITAGEKERGTMETTLTLFATRKELVVGKYCAVVAANLIVAVIMLFFLLISYFSALLMSSSANLTNFCSFQPKPYLSYLIVVLYFAAVYPAILILIGLFARSTKEAFSYLGPLMIFTAVPMVATVYGVRLTLFTALVPGLNCLLIVQQFLNSSVDWIYWFILLSSAIVYSYVCIKGAIYLMERDTVLNRI